MILFFIQKKKRERTRIISDMIFLDFNAIILNGRWLCNMSKTSASVSSGVPDTEKQMKARGRRPSAFIVLRCLEPLMKHEARVFDMASQTSVRI